MAAAMFIGSAFSLGASVILFAPAISLLASPLAALVAAGACRVAAGEPSKSTPREPWGFDAYGLLMVGAAIPALGWVVGPEIEPVVWLFVALLLVLAIHAASGLTERSSAK